MMANLPEFRREFEQLKGRQKEIKSRLKDNRVHIRGLNSSLKRTEKARAIHQEVARRTQENLRFHIQDMVTMAMAAVFEDPYEMGVEFVNRRNKTECDLTFIENGQHMDPLNATGGGAVDVAAFALRVALWTLQNDSRNTIILDEPFKFINDPTGEMQRKCSEVLAKLSKKLGIQFIIVTLDPDLTEAADKVFQMSKRKGISRIKEVS
jgi:DNA repair exonuclease SbcCD ATPase subunit